MPTRREFLETTVKGAAGMALAGGLASCASSQATQKEGARMLAKAKLVEVLKAAGKPTQAATTPDGTTVLLLPYGGRVLGVYAAGSDENFYWTHTALESAESAKAFYASKDWHNSGGDRTWLAPEVDIFLPNYPSKEGYFQPRELDPGNYQVVQADGGIKLVNRLTVNLGRSKQKLGLEITKSIGPAANPLRYEHGLQLDGVQYAGYTQFTSMQITGDAAQSQGPVGLWNLVQMPHGGDLLVPTFFRSQPTVCFGKVSNTDLIVDDHLIRYKMRATGEHKLTMRATASTGRVGYVYRTGDRWAAIIRNYVVNPSGEYVDPPWDAPNDMGYATQACNVNGALGTFSELEYHIPAIGKGTGRSRCDDAAQVWAFRGTERQIQTVVHNLLGVTRLM